MAESPVHGPFRLGGCWVQRHEPRQASLKASKQELSKRLATLLLEGERLAAAIEKLLTEHYGLRSEKLAQFGLQPFRGRPGNTQPGPEPPAPGPELTSLATTKTDGS